MNTKKNENLLNLYNRISEEKLEKKEYEACFSKLLLIMKKISLDKIELIELLDTLLEFKRKKLLESINNETIGLLKKITNNEIYNLEGTVYFSTILKQFLTPCELIQCENEYNLLIYRSNFEVLLEMINIKFTNDDYEILKKYNSRLSELAIKYRIFKKEYYKNIPREIMLSTIISHLFAIYYFNQEEYNYEIDKFMDIVKNSIDNYQDIVNYIYQEGISNNFKTVYLDNGSLEKEYEVCIKMLDYVFGKEIKRKGKK